MMQPGFLALLQLALTSGAADAPSPLAGTWELHAAEEIKSDGTRIQNYGPDAKGMLMVDGSGRYSLQIFRQGRPRFASGNKYRGASEEYAAASHGLSTHVGRIEFRRAEGMVIFKIDNASFPNWEGTQQRRPYRLTKTEFSYEVPPAADGTVAKSVWRRVH